MNAALYGQPIQVQEPIDRTRPAGPCVLVIFGITGDLTKRLLFPALYNLAQQKLLPEQFAVAGFAMGDFDENGLRDHLVNELREEIPDAEPQIVDWLVGRGHFVNSQFDSEEGWDKLIQTLQQIDAQYGTGGNYLFYMATAPKFFLDVTRQLGAHGLLNGQGKQWRRAIFEKPFGRDLQSAKALNRELLSVAREDQIYRIDHYLGKETVQNIMVFRFANGIFEPVWNRRYVDHVQITVSETVGVEKRGGYYDQTGALRDMVPNHLIQLIALTAMEPPSSFSASAIQNEQVKVLEAVPPLSKGEVMNTTVRGQYAGGTMDGKRVPAYRDESMVSPDSNTETYVAMKLTIDNWRWAGVPFYIRTGKRLAKRKSEIVIQFRKAPLALFRKSAATLPTANRLVMRIQPAESISMQFEAKVPGPMVETRPVEMLFCYEDYFGRANRTGYETLLYDAMVGDSSLFKRADMIELGWAIIQPLLDQWGQGKDRNWHLYEGGSEGPAEADQLIERDGRHWLPIADALEPGEQRISGRG